MPIGTLLPLAAMGAVILLTMVARIRLLSVPLERDEGEYAYMGQLMLHGVAPYGAAANMKLPGTSAAYALIMAIFGQTISGIHFGFLLVNLGSVVLIFFLAKRWFGLAAGFSAAAAYAVLSIGASVMGIWAHATHFVVLAALAATLLLVHWGESGNLRILAASGLLFGIAFLMKQPGILFAAFGGLYVIRYRHNLARNVIIFSAAVLLPFGVTCLLLWWAGVFGRFWFWVFSYARQYVSMLPLRAGMGAFRTTAGQIFDENWAIVVLAAAGLATGLRMKQHRAATGTVAVFLACSFLAVCPGLYFRKHYFVVLLPALALLVGALAATARNLVLWAIAAALVFTMAAQSDYLFQASPLEVSRASYQSNPFPEAIPLAAYIRDRTNPADRIAVIGSEPEIYFYANRQSATPYIYMYSLMEPQPYAARMQAEFIHDVESASPKYLVLVNVSSSWLAQRGSPPGILRWAGQYTSQHYETVAVADITHNGTIYRWDADALHYMPQSGNSVLVLRRR